MSKKKQNVTWQDDWRIIQDGINRSGIISELNKYKDNIDAAKKYAKQNLKAVSNEYLEFFITREFIRKIISRNDIWLAYWATDKTRMGQFFEVFDDFRRTGKYPEHYDSASEAVLKWVPNAKVILFMVPRTLGKTFFASVHMIRKYINNPHAKWLIAHSDKDRCKGNLESIKSMIMSPYLSAIMPDLFAVDRESYVDRGGRITREQINLVTFNEEKDPFSPSFRKEATMTLGSPQVDRTGMHFEGCWGDDLVTANTSRTTTATKNLVNYYKNLWGLAETPGQFEMFLTGTEWYENSLYTFLKQKDYTTVFEMPATWDHNGERKFLSNLHNDEILEEIKGMMEEAYAPQIMMQALPLDSSLELVDNDDFLFAYSDETDAPAKIKRVSYTRKSLKRSGCTVTSFDPSYSILNKKLGDDKSKATIGTGVIADNVLYMLDSWQDLGGEFDSLYQALENQVKKHDADFVIMDSQGTQIALANKYKDMLKKDYPDLRFIAHKKGANRGSKGKSERASGVLGEHFRMGEIRVHWRLKSLIDQIKRYNTGFDFLDVLIQMSVNLRWDVVGNVYKSKKSFDTMASDSGWSKYMRKKPALFKVSGY